MSSRAEEQRGERARLRIGPVALLELANLLSGMSNGVVVLAIPWLVLERTGSVAAAGAVAAVSSLPAILSSRC